MFVSIGDEKSRKESREKISDRIKIKMNQILGKMKKEKNSTNLFVNRDFFGEIFVHIWSKCFVIIPLTFKTEHESKILGAKWSRIFLFYVRKRR